MQIDTLEYSQNLTFSAERCEKLIAERMEFMPFMAAYKWDNNIPIEDLKREEEIILQFVMQAKALHIDELKARKLIVSVVQKCKTYQFELFQKWSRQNGRDQLAKNPSIYELRQEIDRINKLLLFCL